VKTNTGEKPEKRRWDRTLRSMGEMWECSCHAGGTRNLVDSEWTKGQSPKTKSHRGREGYE
jgi:hypothetical protein